MKQVAMLVALVVVLAGSLAYAEGPSHPEKAWQSHVPSQMEKQHMMSRQQMRAQMEKMKSMMAQNHSGMSVEKRQDMMQQHMGMMLQMMEQMLSLDEMVMK